LLNKIWLGDENSLESFSNALGLDSCVQIQDVNINSQTLGPLAYGSFKINFFKAILTAAKTLSNVAPPIAVVINALDWLFTNVIKVDTGLVITPTLSAEIVTPISPSSDLSLATTAVVFDEDISSKQTTSTVSYSAKETTNYNSVGLNYGPLVYRLSLTNNWNYYLDLDIDFLSLNIYQNSWSWNLGTFPSFSKEVSASTSQISCSAKLDEPLHATRSESNNGELSIGISDGSGVSNVALLYSTDKVSWERMDIQAQGGQYKAKPISSVQQDTTVYYFFEATDGDNDVYRIDNNGVYYTYLLKPEQTSGDSSFLDFGNTFSGFNLLFIIVAIIVIITIVCTFLLVKQRKKNRIL
jgi:hypothetical protein